MFGRTPEWVVFGRTPEWVVFETTPEWVMFGMTPEWVVFGTTPERIILKLFGMTSGRVENRIILCRMVFCDYIGSGHIWDEAMSAVFAMIPGRITCLR